jgi:signal transduction histidine kinase
MLTVPTPPLPANGLPGPQESKHRPPEPSCLPPEAPDSREALERQVQAHAGELARVNEQLRREIAERQRLGEALSHGQRIEALGRLAGGVAHDLNNVLTVILGYSDILLRRHKPTDPQAELLEQIRRSGERATALTRQLLAFSRKPETVPRILDLNALIGDLVKMLGRMIGEDIDLVTTLAAGLWPVTANPSQLELVLLHLAANARDAMSEGGKFLVQTSNLEVRGSEPGVPEEVGRGRYVVLTVSDTGCSTDGSPRSGIFEPLFSSKEPGKGSGPGLTSVHDIIRQCQGQVAVSMDPGQGTVFRIYLRAAEQPAKPGTPGHAVTGPARGSETVLLAEDDDQLRPLLRRVLGQSGFTVLEACNGREALELCEQHEGPIDVMVTDVVMPYMSGPEVARRLGQRRPGMKVLYMSGYPGEAALRHGVPDLQKGFLQKPFTGQALENKVREVLGR